VTTGRVARWTLFACLLAGLVACFQGGVDFIYLKRADLLIAGAVVVWLLLRAFAVPFAGDDSRDRRVLIGFAVLSTTVYLNFFSFHGQHTFVHYHDVAHYYLGSKYFPELGYDGLYKAMLRAEKDVFGAVAEPMARDLDGGELMPAADVLGQSGAVRERFSADRWADFKQDVVLFRQTLGPQYHEVIEDHGFNPTPVWGLLGGALARRVPAGSHAGVLALCLLDPLLLLITFVIVARTFGVRTMLLALIHFSLVFGASFGWTGGAYLRYMWFTAITLAVCALYRGRPVMAGILIGAATALRVFPALFAVGAVAHVLVRRDDKAARRQVASWGVTAAVLVAATLLVAPGPRAWLAFAHRIHVHMDANAPNIIGLGHVIRVVTGWRPPMALFLPLVLVGLWHARRLSPLAALALGVPLAFVMIDLASYYWIVLVLLTIVFRDRPRGLVALLALELATYALFLFDPNEAQLYVARSVVLALVLCSLTARRLHLYSLDTDGQAR
jgi:hypothetical protein